MSQRARVLLALGATVLVVVILAMRLSGGSEPTHVVSNSEPDAGQSVSDPADLTTTTEDAPDLESTTTSVRHQAVVTTTTAAVPRTTQTTMLHRVVFPTTTSTTVDHYVTPGQPCEGHEGEHGHDPAGKPYTCRIDDPCVSNYSNHYVRWFPDSCG